MKYFSLLGLLLLFFQASGQAQTDPVQWQYEARATEDGQFDVVFTATVAPGWNIYSQHTDPSGPVPTAIVFAENDQLELVGATEESGKRKEGMDDLFGVTVIKFADQVVFTQRVQAKSGAPTLTGYIEYMSCDDEKCLPPKEVDFSIPLK